MGRPLETVFTKKHQKLFEFTLSRRRYLSYRNQSIDLLCKLIDWFLYDRDLRHERIILAAPEESNSRKSAFLRNNWQKPSTAIIIYKGKCHLIQYCSLLPFVLSNFIQKRYKMPIELVKASLY